MGELIVLAQRLRDRPQRSSASRPAFFFDLACPLSYLAAERIERILGELEGSPWLRARSRSVPGGLLTPQRQR
jgi:hypothetical protein